MDDQSIIALYNERDERAISETQKKYRSYCLFIARSILGDEEEAKECENDAYLGVWNSVPPNSPKDLRSYIGAVTRKTALKRIEKRTAEKRGGGRAEEAFEEFENVLNSDGINVDGIALRDALQRFLQALPKQERIIFVQRYWYFLTITEIAKDRGKSESCVKASLFRTRGKLKAFLVKEGFTI